MKDSEIMIRWQENENLKIAAHAKGLVREFLEDQIKKEADHRIYLKQNSTGKKIEDECNDFPYFHLTYKRGFD